jgi:hypothetical protein
MLIKIRCGRTINNEIGESDIISTYRKVEILISNISCTYIYIEILQNIKYNDTTSWYYALYGDIIN